jgi:hypothetical protein
MPKKIPVAKINRWIDQAVTATSVYDLHTHIYPPAFGPLMLWGIDELVTYHYLIAETLTRGQVTSDQFWAMPVPRRADVIWQTLFVDHAPVSEACRGVLTVMQRLGLDTSKKDLKEARKFFKGLTAARYVDLAFKAANVSSVVMTNDVLEPTENRIWMSDPPVDPRFKAVLRIDPILQGWPAVAGTLRGYGYDADADLGSTTMAQVRRFLDEWLKRIKALYVAVSLTPDWRYPDDSPTTRVIDECVLPVAREHNVPFALMIGVRRQVNPALKLAGDAVGKSDIASVDRLCAHNPHNKFLLTMLARENQHELAVTARKHANLMIFGCWWFLNNPVLIEEITRMRMELLGERFIPQHSDARILDQIIYKWAHSRAIIARVLKDKYADLAATGWKVTQAEIQRTVKAYFSQNFEDFLAWTPA